VGEGFFGRADTGRGSGVPMSTVFASEALEAVKVPSSVARNTGTVFVEVRLVSWADTGQSLNISDESGGAFVALSAFFVPEVGRGAGDTRSIGAVVRFISRADTGRGSGVPMSTVFASEALKVVEIPSSVA
jgi:hypothetical protein